MAPSEFTARQSQLLDLALELVQEHGFAGLTVRKLAQRVGFSEAALYRHFASKQALLRALTRRISSSIIEPAERLAAQVALSPQERIRRILTLQTQTILAVRGLPILLLSEGSSTGDDELLAILRSGVDRFLSILSQLIEEARGGSPCDDLPAAPEVAHLLFGLGTATAIRHRLHPDEKLEEAVTSRLPVFLVDRLVGHVAPAREE